MRSDKNVIIMIQLAIHAGREDDLRGIADDMCAATAKEEGMLNYEWSLSEDGKTCHILERYADSDALRAHLETFGAFAERFFGMVDIVNVEVYGSPDAQVRAALSEASSNSAKFNRPYAGFVR